METHRGVRINTSVSKSYKYILFYYVVYLFIMSFIYLLCYVLFIYYVIYVCVYYIIYLFIYYVIYFVIIYLIFFFFNVFSYILLISISQHFTWKHSAAPSAGHSVQAAGTRL